MRRAGSLTRARSPPASASALPPELLGRAAQLGEAGDVDGALDATQQADAAGRQHDVLRRQLTEPERSMSVCEICGVFINSTDNEQRRLVSGGVRAVA